jgi:hypothetical protein
MLAGPLSLDAGKTHKKAKTMFTHKLSDCKFTHFKVSGGLNFLRGGFFWIFFMYVTTGI